VGRVLVTGGTGTLGTYLVERLVRRGHEVRALSRTPGSSSNSRAEYVRGDVVTGIGLDQAVEGVEAVVHAAAARGLRMRDLEVRGTKNTLAAARSVRAHFVYVSIVGIDHNRFPYYQAKLAAERVVESGPADWSIQRATQFHELLDGFLNLPVLPVTRHMAFQLVDAGDLSERLVDLVEAGPSGRAEDFGGPEVLGVREIDAIRRRVTQRKGRLVSVPPLWFFGDFDRGTNLCPGLARGKVTWEQWLRSRGSGGESSSGQAG